MSVETNIGYSRDSFSQSFQCAEELRQEKKWDEAVVAYAAALKLNQTHAVCQFRLGFCFEKLQNWRCAVDSYERALALKSTKAKWLYRLAIVYQRLKDRDSAFKIWKRYFSCIKDKVPENAYISFSRTCRQLGHLDQAESILQESLETYDRSPKFLVEAALLAADKGDQTKAADLWRELLCINPSVDISVKAWLGLSQTFQAMADLVKSEAVLFEALEKHIEEPKLLLGLAEIAVSKHLDSGIEKHLLAVQDAYQGKPPHRITKRLAQLYRQMGQPNTAHQLLLREFYRFPAEQELSPAARKKKQTLNLLNYTKVSGSGYDATQCPAGYHTFVLDGEVVQGRRDPALRLAAAPFDFTDKTVLDIGCNQGGMLLTLGQKLKSGIGLDFDSRMINVAQVLRAENSLHSLNFFVFDLENDDINLIHDFLPEPRVDIVFLLAMCRWLSNWQQVIDFAASISPCLLFESNGSQAQQDEQIAYIQATYSSCELLSAKSVDDPLRADRALYLCSF